MSRHDSTKISDVKVLLKMGSDGSGIVSIEKTGTSGLVDTYTITFDNGNKTTFTVTNGNGIASIEKTGTSLLTDTYTITFDNGATSTFEVVNGRGITDISKTATQGTVDTYTITYNDETTSTFTVTNGEGSTASTLPYDNTTSGLSATNVQDAIDEVDGIVDNKADQALIAPIQTSLVASRAYAVDEQFIYNGLLYKATADIASGGIITIGGNATVADDVISQISNLAKNVAGTRVDLASHTSLQTAYTTQADGYIYLNNQSNANLDQQVLVYDSAGTNLAALRNSGPGTFKANSLFVKKGMKLWRSDGSSAGVAWFYPLES